MNNNKMQKSASTNKKSPELRDMDRILKECGIELTAGQLSLLWQYHIILRQANAELNLTRIHRFENMVIKLYADSILPGQIADLPSPLLDLGTGPGMPGIPLKIAFPDLKIVLAETRQNRVLFLEKTISALGLSGISVHGHAITPLFENSFAGVITRAVENIGKTLDRINGCLEKGGLAIFMKGPKCQDEIAAAEKNYKNSFKLVQDTAYTIGETPNKRRLVIFERLDLRPAAARARAIKKHMVRDLQSTDNQAYKDLKKLLSARNIKKQNRAMISGARLTAEIIKTRQDKCLAWVSKSENHPPPESMPDTATWHRLAPELFETLDVLGTGTPLLVVKIPEIPTWEPKHGLPPGCSVLVPFQDPENVGAVIRSAMAFGADRIILLAEAAHPFHPKAVRASGGTVMQASFMQGPSINDLPDDLPVAPLAMDGTPISEFEFPETFALLPGMEGPGLPEKFHANALSIPMSNNVESLNAAAATAVALYAWSLTRRQ
jgi:16S rRNA (guanine527-N7)-methyltransferase